MFNFNKSKDKPTFYKFPLEKELSDKNRAKSVAKHIESKINALKAEFRKSVSKERSETLEILLNAYHSLVVVLNRVTKSFGN